MSNYQTPKWRIQPCTTEDKPSAPVRQGTPWPNAGLASENLFETRKDWPILPIPVPTPAPGIKTEEPPQVAAIPSAMVMPKQATEKWSWGLHCPFARTWKSMKRTRMVICRTNLECTPKILSTPSHRTFSAQPQKSSVPPATEQSASWVTKLSAPPAAEPSALPATK